MSGSLLFQCFRKQSTASWIDQVTACASEHGGIFRPSEFLHGELAAEPVPELRKALNLHEDEFVVLTKACYGLIDAPRRWWKSLVPDTQQLGWRSCRHVPCLMTWHVRGRLKGLMCFHVDDVMISGPRDDPEFQTYDGEGETSVRVGRMGTAQIESVWFAEYEKQQTSPSQLIKRVTPERSDSSQCPHTGASMCPKSCQQKSTQH